MWNKIYYNYGEPVGDAIFLREISSVTGRRMAVFLCKCGNEFSCQIHKVKILETKSCGCLHKKATKEANSTHGLSGHKLYRVWKSMRARCYNKNTAQYNDYGGRGVTVCDEWDKEFIHFFRWCMANGWKEGLQIDKEIKGDGTVYSPATCCFVTPKENSNKRKTSRYITHNGLTKTVSEWADYFDISLKNLYQRISRGWSIEKCFTYGKY